MTRQEDNARYRAKHREELRAHARERMAVRRAEHPDKIKESNAQWRAAHPEQFKASVKRSGAQWAKANRDRRKASAHRRRVALAGGESEVFTDTEIFDRDGWVCQLCCEAIDPGLRNRHPRMPSLDHILPVSRGGNHTRDNVQASHYGCNASKRDRVLA